MTEDIETNHVDRAERCRLRPADDGAGERIDLLDGETHLLHDAHHVQDRECTDTVGDEIGGVLSVNDGFPQTLIAKGRDRLKRSRIRVGRGNDLEQPHIPRRIEKVSPKPIAPEGLTEALDDVAYRQSAGVGSHDRRWFANRLDLL